MSWTRAARLVALWLAAAGVATAGGREFEEMAKAIERHYGTRRTHVPLMGVANLVAKTARPAGASGFKLALFEDLPGPGDEGPAELDRLIGQSAGALQPVVREHSRRGEEATYIFMGEAGRSTRLLIATFDGGRATLVEVNVQMNLLLQLLQSPGQASSLLGQ